MACAGGAGGHGHAAAAPAADGQAGQQHRPRHLTRRSLGRAAAAQGVLGGLVELRADDRRCRGLDDLARRVALPGLRVAPVELIGPGVERPRQDVVQRPDPPAAELAREDPARVQPGADRLDAHRTGLSVALDDQAIHQAHHLGLDRIDGEDLLGPPTLLSRLDRPVAVGRLRSVPEPLPRVLVHRALHVLAVLPGLVLVEHRRHVADQVAGRIVPGQRLCDRDLADPVLGQPPPGARERERVAEEAAEAVHDDDVVGTRAVAGLIEERLELGRPLSLVADAPRSSNVAEST